MSVIYFVQPVGGGPVKIGCTRDLKRRLLKLEQEYCVSFVVLATMDGGFHREKLLHERFAHLRFERTEFFRPALDLMQFIGKPELVHPDPDSVEPLKQKNTAFFLTVDLVRRIKIAAAIRGERYSAYVLRIIEEQTARDIEEEAVKGKK